MNTLKKAREFLLKFKKEKLPAVIDKDGVKRVYDPKMNTFASYEKNGKIRTFFKPREGNKYFENQVDKTTKNGGRAINYTSPPSSGRGGTGGGMGGGAVDIFDRPDFGVRNPLDDVND
jgi:hypothetical protein